MESSEYRIEGGFGDGRLSGISERMYSKEVCESRESLGEYLRFSHSKEGNSVEDTDTLLIV